MYHVFGGWKYYPDGGAYDHQASFDTEDAARVYVQERYHTFDWWHITDSDLQIVYER